MNASDDSPPAPEVIDRADLPRSFLNTAWPLAAAGLILLMLARACMPVASPPAPPPVFDAEAAKRQANASALTALRALPAAPTLDDALAALKRTVISFDTGAETLPDEATEVLQQAAPIIARLPAGSRLLITGHGDAGGDAAAGQSLSLRRAEAVRAALIAYGAPVDTLAVDGAGEPPPVASGDPDAGHLRNRRVDFSAAR